MMRLLLLLAIFMTHLGYAQKKEMTLGLCDTIPSNLYNQKQLKALYITNGMGYCYSPVKILGPEICQLKSLETLIYNSSDTSAKLPSEIQSLSNLTSLTTSNIIPEINKLSHLRILNLSLANESELTNFQKIDFSNFPELESLSIWFGNFNTTGEIFTGLAQLTRLKELSLTNANTHILNRLPSLASLETLAINGLTGELPLDFNAFENLKTIGIKRAPELEQIPLSLYQLKNLTKLSIISTGLAAIDENISNLKQLTELNLGHNKLRKLPDALTRLDKIEILSFTRNFDLELLPENLGDLTSLKRLSAESCQINHIPESAMSLNKLEVLSLKNNEIAVLPENWSKLQQLKQLDLERNKIETIPASMLQLQSLEALYLGSNDLNSSNFKDKQQSVSAMKQLKRLGLQYNELEVLPFDIGSLESLEDLSVYNNRIQFLPESIGDLNKLSSLSMSQNKIKTLPESLRHVKIYEFSLHHNAFMQYNDMVENFPKATRIWVDQRFENKINKGPKLARDVYYR